MRYNNNSNDNNILFQNCLIDCKFAAKKIITILILTIKNDNRRLRRKRLKEIYLRHCYLSSCCRRRCERKGRSFDYKGAEKEKENRMFIPFILNWRQITYIALLACPLPFPVAAWWLPLLLNAGPRLGLALPEKAGPMLMLLMLFTLPELLLLFALAKLPSAATKAAQIV